MFIFVYFFFLCVCGAQQARQRESVTDDDDLYVINIRTHNLFLNGVASSLEYREVSCTTVQT